MLNRIFLFFVASFLCTQYAYAQNLDSAKTSSLSRQKLPSYIAPAVFIGYGAVSLLGNNFVRKLDFSTNAELREDHPIFSVKLDNYLQYSPLVAVYGLDLLGVKAKNSVFDRSASLLLSVAIMALAVDNTKILTNRVRPNGNNQHSFPSGHTATAFMLAEFLNQEYKHKSVWYSVAGYSAATATGVFRMYNKAHWLSDVVAGAGFGMLSTKAAYLLYPKIRKAFSKNKSDNLSLSPAYILDVKGVSVNYRF